LTFLVRRFWNTRSKKNENQLTPAGIYVNLLHSGVSSINATAGGTASSDFYPCYLNFPDSLTGQSLIALLNVVTSFSR
jgi:hypothetical protein